MRLLQIESRQMAIGFLIKQLQLMKSLSSRYWIQVNNKDWKQLLALIVQKNLYIKQVIASGSKAKHILEAEQTLTELIRILSKNLQEYTLLKVASY